MAAATTAITVPSADQPTATTSLALRRNSRLPAGSYIKDTTTATFAARRHRGIAQAAGAGRFLGALVRSVQAADAGAGKGRSTKPGRVRLVKMNIDDHPSIAGQLGIQSIPAVIAFVNGRPVDGFMGAMPESQIRAVHRQGSPVRPAPTGGRNRSGACGSGGTACRRRYRRRPLSSTAPCCRPIRRMPRRLPAWPNA